PFPDTKLDRVAWPNPLLLHDLRWDNQAARVAPLLCFRKHKAHHKLYLRLYIGLSVWSENRVRDHGEGRAKTPYSIVCRCKTAGVAEPAHSADRRFSRRTRITPVTITAPAPAPEIAPTQARGIGCGGGSRKPR